MRVDLKKPSETLMVENKQLYDYLYMLTDTLNFVLNNLDIDNISGQLASSINGADSTSAYVNSVLNPNSLAQLIGNPISSDDGVVFLDSYTMICYGSSSDDSVTFRSAFGAIPFVLTDPHYDKSVSISGFTVTPEEVDGVQQPISLNYIAIGRRP